MPKENDAQQPRSHGADRALDAADEAIGVAETVTRKASRMGPLGDRRLSRRVGLSFAIWLVLFFGARFALEATSLSTLSRVLIALSPVPAFVWFLITFVAGVGEADELERRIQLEALALAFPLTVVLIMTLGLLQVAIPLSPDDWSYRHIWPIVYMFYLFGVVRSRRRYQ